MKSSGAGPAKDADGFALPATLLVLAASLLLATGVFLASRSDLLISRYHVASVRALYVAEAGLATYIARAGSLDSVASYSLEGGEADVAGEQLLQVDTLRTLYRVTSEGRAALGGVAQARRTIRVLVIEDTLGRRRRAGTWSERF